MDEDLKDIKWELTHENYIKEKFDLYHSWFMQLEKKIQQLDQNFMELKKMIAAINSELTLHKQVIDEEDKQEEEKIDEKKKSDNFKTLNFLNRFKSSNSEKK